jgi:Asp-tRNA(Asn)/Glu-tRNA(Gln) amidotransferase A subunit family amidase
MNIGFIGLGTMGAPMAGHLLRAGNAVHVWSRRATGTDSLVALGATRCASPAAVAGYPNITVPAGDVFGLPVGISFFGRAYSEPVLLKLAFSFERSTKARKAPRFLTTAP